MTENKNVKVLSGPKPLNELTDEERKELKQKYASMGDTRKIDKKEG